MSYNILIESGVPRVQENQEGLKLNKTHKLLAYANDFNVVGKNRYHTEKHKSPLDASKDIGLEASPEKTKCIQMSRCQKAGQRHSIKIPNRCIEDVAKFKYLGTTLTDQNCIHVEIKSRLNSGNACYHSVQSLLSSRLLSRNVKVKIHKP
jgi:hypothetical protein